MDGGGRGGVKNIILQRKKIITQKPENFLNKII